MNKEERFITGLRSLFDKLVWLNKIKMEDALKGYTPSEIHCIEYIGRNADANVTRLAESFFMTNGAISKIAKKLIKKGTIISYRKPDNKKEIYFCLTPQGNELFKVHETLHDEFYERDKAVFGQVTGEEFDGMLNLIEKYNKHLDAEIKKQSVNNKE
ncbi:MAG: MarR family transcriptional regulator [Clostridiales bacterium]|jgi:DNA-binding MarR family transcriptional regulator|nr:MarR family transcriptional regulator [Clostridiales bacterium]